MKGGKLEKLEALRGFAAMYVVIHHFNLGVLNLPKYSILNLIISQGQAAVMLFFVLSGFVIQFSATKPLNEGKFDFRSYFLKRFRRIYPVFLGALLVAYLAAVISDGTWLPVAWDQLIGNILNFQDHPRLAGIEITPFFHNGPLWSLSYEWWFYLMFFPLAKYVPQNHQKYYALGISLFGFFSYFIFPNKVSITLEYFIIWWSGVELARFWIKSGNLNPAIRFVLISLGLLIVLNGIQAYLFEGELVFRKHPVIQLRHFIYSFGIVVIGYTWRKWNFIGFKVLLNSFLFFAPISYGIYVFHAPLTLYNELFTTNKAVNYLVGFVLTLILSYLFEVRLQKVVNRVTQKWLKKGN